MMGREREPLRYKLIRGALAVVLLAILAFLFLVVVELFGGDPECGSGGPAGQEIENEACIEPPDMGR